MRREPSNSWLGWRPCGGPDSHCQYSDEFRAVLVREGIHLIRLPPRSPGYCVRIFDAHKGLRYNAHVKKRFPPRRRDRTAAKRATNVSIRSDLLDAARQAGVNLSATLERALAEELASVRRARWREDNREAIAAYNDYVDEHGTFSDGVRSF
jgi:antitoxin CcdA